MGGDTLGSVPLPLGATRLPVPSGITGLRVNGRSATITPTTAGATSTAAYTPTPAARPRYLYLARPIDFARPADAATWLGEALLLLRKRGFVVFDPARAWSVPFEYAPDGRLQEGNRRMIDLADAVLALLPPGVQTYGVPAECEYARTRGKPVAVVGAAGSWAMACFPCFPEPLGAISWLLEQPVGPEIPESVLRVSGDGKVPTRAYPDDAGLDLYVHGGPWEIPPGGFADVDCGIAIELPPGTWGLITGRSSTLRRKGLLVAQGVIDGGYRGPLYAGCWNLSEGPATVVAGERLAQLVVHSNMTERVRIEQVEVLNNGSRGERGFGSSGQ